MQKKLIKLSVPGLAGNYDILAPADMEIGRLIPVLIEGVNGLNNGRYCPSGKEMLLAEKWNAVLKPDRMLGDYDLQDGERLILI